MWDDTIIAVSTPPGFGGLGVVRLSGPQALEISLSLFRPQTRRSRIPSRRPLLGHLADPGTGEVFEKALLTFFPGPRSYTTEDIVELSTHGSPVLLEEIVRLGIAGGARHAHPGEFTLRAFLGGRIDILQAEAVNDLIQATSLTQAKISFRQLEGGLSRRIQKLRREIIHILSQIETSLEFPDEGIAISQKTITRTIRRSWDTVDGLIASYDLGKTYREGIVLAITGRTNSGKSTLFNTLLEQDRAIVTPFPGTTRDFLREQVTIGGAVFTLVDMAGQDSTSHPVEQEGIQRGARLASQADGILLLLDVSRPEHRDDLELIRKYRHKPAILLWNKCDLPRKHPGDSIKETAGDLPQLEISALLGDNIAELRQKIQELFIPDQAKQEDIILHLRQKLLLEEIRKAFEDALEVLEQGFSEEVLAEEIRRAIPVIGQLTGEIRSEDILDDIFSRFCIGK
jgi:tRNA modification GTPase